MKFTIAKTELQRLLETTLPVTRGRETLPVLSHALIEAEDGVAKVTCTSLDVFATANARADVEVEGRALVVAADFAELVKSFRPGPVTLEMGKRGVTVGSGKSKTTLCGLHVDEFPARPRTDRPSVAVIPADVFKALLKCTAFAVSKEQSRPILNGVLIELRADSLVFTATSGIVLATAETKGSFVSGDGGAVIALPSVLSLVASAISGDEPLTVTWSDANIRLATEDFEIESRCVEGPYPQYERVFDGVAKGSAVFPTGELREAVARAAMIGDDRSAHRASIEIGAEGATVMSRSEAGEHDENVAAKLTGDATLNAFNGRSLLLILNHVGTDDVRIDFCGMRAMKVTPVNGQSPIHMRALLQPLREPTKERK